MRCAVCTRCGKCGPHPAAPISESGVAELPRLVPRAGSGAAVDIGSTTIVARVYDLATGELLHRAATFNPQSKIAADVMGRISAAMAGRLDELRDLVRGAVRDCLGGFRIREAVVAGNTTMLHLFAGASPASYATAPFKSDRLFGERMEVDGMDVRLPRCAHGFFGADAVAAVRMSGMCARGGCELLADIGTNGEIALWRGDRRELTVASVAAGPAFERPGITGSQIIAALADALDDGTVDETGRARGSLPGGLMQDDVRAVQLAKAAVRAGLDTLLAKSGVAYGDVTRFSLAGGFGSGLDVAKAARIGLFARDLQPVAAVCGNLAIEGATAALFDPAFGDETDRIAHEARHVELGGDPEFSDAFIEAISFDGTRKASASRRTSAALNNRSKERKGPAVDSSLRRQARM